MKNQKGATSILVILMLIVLSTLGAFSIVSSNINNKFSKEVWAWNEKYFELDSKAQEFIKDFDYMLAKSEDQALTYMHTGDFENLNYPVIDDRFQEEILNYYKESGNLPETMGRLYLYFIDKNLPELTEKYEDISVEKGEDIWFSKNFVSDIDADFNLMVRLKVEPVNYTWSNVENNIKGTNREPNLRYSVLEYREWQVSHDKAEYEEIWSGTVPE